MYMNAILRGKVLSQAIRVYSSKTALSKRPILPNKEYSPSSIVGSQHAVLACWIDIAWPDSLFFWQSQFFIDFKATKLKAGKGGDGLVSFMNLKEKEFCGPDGGDGGNGGHVLFEGGVSKFHLKIQRFF